MKTTKIEGAFFHHIALRAKDYDASIKFYRDALGMKIKGEWGNPGERGAMIIIGNGGMVELYEGGTTDLPTDFQMQNGCYFHLAIAVDDVDAAYEIALKAGARKRIEPRNNTIDSVPPMPIRLAFVYGPSGEQIEFFKDL